MIFVGLLVVPLVVGALVLLEMLVQRVRTRLVNGPGSAVRVAPAARAIAMSCLALGFAVVLQLTPINSAVNRIAGFNLVWPLQHALVLLSGYMTQLFFLFSIEPEDQLARRRGRRLAIPFVVTLVVVITLFLLAPDARDFVYGPAGRNESGGPGNPIAQSAFTLYSAYLGVTVAILTVLSWRWMSKARSLPFLRTGLFLSALGCGLSTVYYGHKLVHEVVLFAGHTLPWTESSVGLRLMPIAVTLATLGVLIGKFGDRVALRARPLTNRARETRIARRRVQAYRDLFPLWNRFVEQLPGIAMDPRTIDDAGNAPDDARYHLTRLLIEISDGVRQIRPHVPTSVYDQAEQLARQADLDAEQSDAVVQASVIRVGLDARLAGDSPVATGATRSFGPNELANEVAWWRRVAHAYDSPIVVQVHTDHLRTAGAEHAEQAASSPNNRSET
ncbi:MAB_1171c family putative transporter [Lentzea sp. NPDC102401]|uniref:MAB_1171c family putative transporter n=1 Tax=Lentzea sp. NPDC102401 TaxID=3364128 RepID=UPI0037FB54B4